MKKYFLIFCFVFCGHSHSQLATFDLTNYIANYATYIENVNQYKQMLDDFEEFSAQTGFLQDLMKEGGAWDQTYKALEKLRDYMEKTKYVLSAVKNRDAYALIDHLDIDDDWKNKMHTILEETHGFLPDSQFNAIVNVIGNKNPVLEEVLRNSRHEAMASLEHRMNSYYYLSAKKKSRDKRHEVIEKQDARVRNFKDRSQGESMNMMNAQTQLIIQQNEEILSALEHQISAAQNDYMERHRQKEEAMKQIISHEMRRRSLDYDVLLNPEHYQ